MTQRLLATASLALIAATMLSSQAAQADVRTFRFGVVAGAPTPTADLDRMREARVKSVRVYLHWASIEAQRPIGPGCTGAQYQWDTFDRFVGGASRRDIRVLPFFFGSPGYAASEGQRMPSTGSPAIEDYKCFVRAAVARYGRGGSYPTLINPRAAPITEWQAWNEPNLPGYAARGDVNPKEYARFVKTTTATVRGVDQRAAIVLAGMPEQGKNGMLSTRFLRQFYSVKGIRRSFNAVAIHPYAVNHRGVKGYLIRLRDTLRDLGDARRSVWITEVGWATSGPRDAFTVTTERGQAKRLRNTFEMIKANRRRFNIGTVQWFRWRDAAPYGSTQWWGDYAGLYKKNGNPKASCNSFARFTGGWRPCRAIADGGGLTGSFSAAEEREPKAALIPSPPE